MPARLFHIFRNNHLGREMLLQSIYFCKAVGAYPAVYIPTDTTLWLSFANKAVQVALDASYLTSPETATDHVTELAEHNGIPLKFIDVENSSVPTIHSVRTTFDFMTCPRSFNHLSARISLGHLGLGVRRIIRFAPFPILITSPAFKKWNNIAVLFGGSANAVNALKLGLRISRVSDLPVDVFTQMENTSRKSYEKVIEKNNLEKEMRRRVNAWHIFEHNSFEENLYQVPHDALVVLGAYGHSLLKDMVFGSKMEKIQSTLPNNLLIVGAEYTESNSSLPAWFPYQ